MKKFLLIFCYLCERKLLLFGEIGKGCVITFIILFGFNPVFSQNDTSQFYNKTLSKNNFSIELGGKGFLYSVGYERILLRSRKFLLTSSVNLSYEPFAGFDGIIIPIGISTLLGEERNKLLLGLFATSGLDFNPYPKTRKERLTYKASSRVYYPPYRLFYIVPSVGYRRYFKNFSSVTFEFTYLIYNNYGQLFFAEPGLVPWFGINYNLKL